MGNESSTSAASDPLNGPLYREMRNSDPTYVAWLDDQVTALQHALEDAIEEIESWAAYAGDYFRDKHDLAGTLERLRGVLRASHL